MPKLRNFCVIQDTATGKYLVGVGGSGYYGKPRNNAWSVNGNFYKATQVEKKLREASRVVAQIAWYNTHPDLPPEPHWNTPGYSESLAKWREISAECNAWVQENTVIPETWMVMTGTMFAQAPSLGTPAREWRAP